MIETIPFGATGHQSSRVIFGAAALGNVSQDEADDALELLLEHGSTTSTPRRATASRSSGSRPGFASTVTASSSRPRPASASYAAAREQIRRSLERMGVDQVDLIQLHCLVHPAEWELALSEDGALRAAVEAREEGLVRFIGVTGHGLTIAEMHRRSLERFAFDSVLFPYSHVIMQDAQYAADVASLLAICRERNVAVQTIKAIAQGPWGSREHSAATWYEPLVEQPHIDLAVHWVLGEPGIFLNGPGDLELLPRCSMRPSASPRVPTRRRWPGSRPSTGSAHSSPERPLF